VNPQRRPLIAGNWKMNAGGQDACPLAAAVAKSARDADRVDVVVAPPFTALAAVAHELDEAKSKVTLAAQNMHAEVSGAFTGEISASMLKDAGATWVILGHSERRQLFGETDDDVHRKCRAVLQHDMMPIVCVGETLEERDHGETEARVVHQLTAAFTGVKPADAERAVVAYEPIWCIGTGRNATPEDANATIGVIRETLRGLFGSTADAMRIQYGGSVKPGNIADLMAMPEIDGALVGGASLDPDDFARIIQYRR
jgi:triosephosphate isomerase